MEVWLTMHKTKRSGKILVTLILVVVHCASCSSAILPPNSSNVESFFRNHEKELQILTKYIAEQDCETFYIFQTDGTATADLKHIKIKNDAVLQSIESIISDGCIDIYKDTTKNSIQFILWKRTRDEADCGLLYALTSEKAPKAEFQTEIAPLSEDGWYYYLAEYNKWRRR